LGKIVAGVGRGTSAVGTSAPLAVLGVQGRRLGGKPGALKQAMFGTPEELGRVSPAALARRAATASGKDALDVAGELEKNKEAMALAKKSGSAKKLHDQLEKQGKTDVAAFEGAGKLGKHIVNQLPDEKARVAATGISGKDAFKYVDEKNYAGYAPHLQKDAIMALGDSLKPEMRQTVAADLAARQANGTLDDYMARKNMNFSDLPVGTYSGTSLEAQAIADRVAKEAAADPALAKKIYSDLAKRNALQAASNRNFSSAKAGPQKGRSAAAAIPTGGVRESDITADVGIDLALLPAAALIQAAQNTPRGDVEAQNALKRAVSEAAKNGTSDVSEQLLRSDAVSHLINPTVARAARNRSSRHIGAITLRARSAASDSEKAGNANMANDICQEIRDLNIATRDLAQKESEIAAQKHAYAQAEHAHEQAVKSGSVPAIAATNAAMDTAHRALKDLTTELNQLKTDVDRTAGFVEIRV